MHLEPYLTTEKCPAAAPVDCGEKFAPAYTGREMIERAEA